MDSVGGGQLGGHRGGGQVGENGGNSHHVWSTRQPSFLKNTVKGGPPLLQTIILMFSPSAPNMFSKLFHGKIKEGK